MKEHRVREKFSNASGCNADKNLFKPIRVINRTNFQPILDTYLIPLKILTIIIAKVPEIPLKNMHSKILLH
eukprot:UN03020